MIGFASVKECFPSRDPLVSDTDDPGLPGAWDAGDVQGPHVTMDDVSDLRVDVEVFPGVAKRRFRVGESVPPILVVVVLVPVIQKIVVQMQASVYDLTQARNLAAVIIRGDTAVLREVFHFADPLVF